MRQQRALLDQYSPQGRNSKALSHAADLQANENQYWHSVQHSSHTTTPLMPLVPAMLITDAAKPVESGNLLCEHQLEQCVHPSGHNSARSSKASSVVSLGVKRVANRKPQHEGSDKSGLGSAGNEHVAYISARLLQPELDCDWCHEEEHQ